MASRKEQKQALRQQRLEEEALAHDADRARALRNRVLGVLAAAAVGLAGLFAISSAGGGPGAVAPGGPNAESGKFPFQVGDPGPGQPAPPVRLPATSGDRFDLEALRGKTTLLYFQEGVGCQPCWDQIRDLERPAAAAKLKALGVDSIVSITTNELGQLRQKADDEGIATPVLSDPDRAVSKAYGANQYGMMGDAADGHSFVLVGPDGRITWRADYGGAPNYTMYVPSENLFADLRKGLAAGA